MSNKNLHLENDSEDQYEFWNPMPFVSFMENISDEEHNEIMFRIKRIITLLILISVTVIMGIIYGILRDCSEYIKSMQMDVQRINQSIDRMEDNIESINESIERINGNINELDSRVSDLESLHHINREEYQ